MPMASQFDLHGKVALVTGASGGLGKRFATVLANAGASVGLAARRVADLQTLADEIRAAGGKAAVAKLDVKERSSVEEAVRAIESELGPISILVNNSGISIGRPVLEQTEQ